LSSELEAAARFVTHTDDAVAGELVSVVWGKGLFDPERPLVSDANYVRATEGAELGASHLVETAEPLFAERGLGHRRIDVPDEAAGRALRRGFQTLGWRSVDELVMASVRPPPSVGHAVEEVSFDELREPMRDVELAEPPPDADPSFLPQLADQLASRDELIAAATRERRFAVREERAVVAWCRLYAGDGVGQVEQVITHPAHRNRGYARAVVSRAVAASRERGDELTFLLASADDWPQELYRRLGFETVGRLCRFRRPPTTGAARSRRRAS
jgi:GNAT superfamily N-acetyltransferase